MSIRNGSQTVGFWVGDPPSHAVCLICAEKEDKRESAAISILEALTNTRLECGMCDFPLVGEDEEGAEGSEEE